MNESDGQVLDWKAAISMYIYIYIDSSRIPRPKYKCIQSSCGEQA